MKKIFTAMMVAAISMSAMATDYVPVSSLYDMHTTPQAFQNLPLNKSVISGDIVRPVNNDIKKISRIGGKNAVNTRAEAIGEDLVGDYWITYNDLSQIFQNGMPMILCSIGYIEEYIDPTSSSEEYTLALPFLYTGGLEPEISLMEFPIHVKDNKMTIKAESYNTGAGTLTLRIYKAVYDQEEPTTVMVDEMETEFTGSGFTFDRDYVISVYDEGLKRDYFVAAYATFQKSEASNNTFNMGWKSLGAGVYQDGWMLSLFEEGRQSEILYDVEVQQSEIDENVYRIVNPYGANSPFAQVNEGVKYNGSIQFNVSDPEHVYFQAVPTNYMNAQQGISQFFATNNLTIYVEGLGWDVDSAIGIMEGYDLWATFKDGVLTVPSKYDAETGAYQNDALFSAPEMGFGVFPYFGSNWKGKDGLSLNMECKLWFPGVFEAGVEGIEDDSNAPVRYYNLQGVEVANPEKGQLLIKRQGAKAEKIIF